MHSPDSNPENLEADKQKDKNTCGYATASFTAGLLCLLVITLPVAGLLAIFLGIISLFRIRKYPQALKGRGFAIAGIVIPVAYFILLHCIFLIYSSLPPRKLSNEAICGTHLKSLSTAVFHYCHSNRAALPADNWRDLMVEERDVPPEYLICPDTDAVVNQSSYAMNGYIAGKNRDQLPPDIVLFFETASSSSLGGPEDIHIVHEKRGVSGLNVAFTDGHVEFIPANKISDLKWFVDEQEPSNP